MIRILANGSSLLIGFALYLACSVNTALADSTQEEAEAFLEFLLMESNNQDISRWLFTEERSAENGNDHSGEVAGDEQ